MPIVQRSHDKALTVAGTTIIFLTAFVVRIGVVLNGAGYHANLGYDDSVYYAAADAFIHGRMPYRDFILLHPPGIMLLLAPFAAFGDVTSDHTGFIIADLAFTVLAAINAALVVLVARRMWLRVSAALTAGACYALYVGAVTAEYSTRLEPVGNFLVLLGLLAFFGKSRTSWRTSALCGAAFGAATCVKIWWSVPLAVIVVAYVVLRQRRAAISAVCGAAVTMIVVNGPFFLMARGQMWTMVLREQVGRPRDKVDWLSRLRQLTTLDVFGGGRLVLVCVVVALLAAIVLAWQVRVARPVVAMGVLQVVVLCLAPSWFFYYPDYITGAAALTLGAAADRLLALRTGSRLRAVVHGVGWIPAAFLAASLAMSYTHHIGSRIRPFPGAPDMAAAVASERCVMANTPMALIEVNALSRDFANGCINWVDVVGQAYGPDRPTGAYDSRAAYPKWQHALRRYLTAGNAAVITKRRATGMDPATRRYVGRGGLLEKDGQTKVFMTKPTNPRY